MTIPLVRPGRVIEGISAVLLPFGEDDRPDWPGFQALLDRTWAAGLRPAVNMDTGYVNLLTADERRRVLRETQETSGGRPFVAGGVIERGPRAPLRPYRRAIAGIL